MIWWQKDFRDVSSIGKQNLRRMWGCKPYINILDIKRKAKELKYRKERRERKISPFLFFIYDGVHSLGSSDVQYPPVSRSVPEVRVVGRVVLKMVGGCQQCLHRVGLYSPLGCLLA